MPITQKMKKILFKGLVVSAFMFIISQNVQAAGQEKNTHTIESRSHINWIQKTFDSDISLDVDKAGIPMPSGKVSATDRINSRIPNLVKNPLLTLYLDSSHQLGDMILENDITFEDLCEIINTSKKTLGHFSDDSSLFNMKHSIKIDEIGSLFVRHNAAYAGKKSIERISSRPYTGIIIDARGQFPVHGEFIESKVHPCFFPRILNENIDVVYERSMMESRKEKNEGLCHYDFSDDEGKYRDRAGSDPLHIIAKKTYGHNRTDIIISNEDALKIVSIPENQKLLKEGKVVILLDKDELVYDVSAPDKDVEYYVTYRKLKMYNPSKLLATNFEDGPDGIRFTFNLNYIADSAELLPSELQRITNLAEMLKETLKNDTYTIFVAGHTADIGQHENQMKLSVERTQTVIKALVKEGFAEELFTYRGYGETVPIGDNSTPEGRAENRRVEITLRPRATYIQYTN